MGRDSASGAGRVWRPDPPPMRVKVPLVVALGCAAWAVALAATLLVPAWHTGDRAWWPWACVAGIVIGALGELVLRARSRAHTPARRPRGSA